MMVSVCVTFTAYVTLCHLIAISIVTDGKHKVVPQEVFQEAEQYAKVSSVVSYACTWA